MSGTYLDSFDTNASGNADPHGITTDGTYLYVTDGANQEVYRYTLAGSYLDSFDTAGSGGVSSPYGITTDGTYFYITD